MIETVSIVIENEEGKILALKRASQKRHYADKWDIISGTIEKNETPRECFERELFEEIGVKLFLSVETKNSYIYKDGKDKWLVYPFKCVLPNDVKIILNEEHSGFCWLTLDEMLETDHAKPLPVELAVWYSV